MPDKDFAEAVKVNIKWVCESRDSVGGWPETIMRSSSDPASLMS